MTAITSDASSKFGVPESTLTADISCKFGGAPPNTLATVRAVVSCEVTSPRGQNFVQSLLGRLKKQDTSREHRVWRPPASECTVRSPHTHWVESPQQDPQECEREIKTSVDHLSSCTGYGLACGPSRLPTPPAVSLFYWVEVRTAVKPSLHICLYISDSHPEEEGMKGTHLLQVEAARGRERKRTNRGKSRELVSLPMTSSGDLEITPLSTLTESIGKGW